MTHTCTLLLNKTTKRSVICIRKAHGELIKLANVVHGPRMCHDRKYNYENIFIKCK